METTELIRKTIKIKFSGMKGVQEHFINILKKYYNIELSENPDYLIYTEQSKDYLDYDCVRIFYTSENLVPDFNICDYAIGFHYLKFGDRYMRYPVYLVDSYVHYNDDNYSRDLQRAMHKHENAEQSLSEKTDFCAFVYSNAKAAYCRKAAFEMLSVYKKVNSGGRYINNVGDPVIDQLEFQKKHKFVIAFENTSMPGYTTEKIVQAYSAGAIPIYWGNPEITKEFDSNSFINCHEFGLTEAGEPKAFEGIVDIVKKIDIDDELYLKYLSTPAFTKENDVERQRSELEKFLLNIFNQDKEQAYRRNRRFWGERYERKQKIGNKFYWVCRKAIPFRDALRNIIKMTGGNSLCK